MTLTVANTGDRPIQVGTHYHFFETNPALAFERDRPRLSARHPGRDRGALRAGPVARGAGWSPFPAARRVVGFNGQINGKLDYAMAMTVSRAAYAHMFGPTTGDRLRLADTDLILEIENDLTVYGEEVKFGGGKVIRDGMGQIRRAAPWARSTPSSPMRW